MNNWNFDLTQAPRGKMVPTTVKTKDGVKPSEKYQSEYIIAAGKCGVVTKSYWIPNEQRWCMFTKDVPPDAWQPWPEHPFASAEKSDDALTTAPTNVSLPVDERSGERANAGGDNVTGVENAHQISAGELVSNSSAPILHKHMFLDDVGGGA